MSPLVCINQHGFKHKTSVSTIVLLYQHKTLIFLNNHVQLAYIYTDFQKAFDKLNHNLLLNRLISFGIHGIFLIRFKSYIIFRTQVVNVSYFTSNGRAVDSGVPRAPHLSSILFILFIDVLFLIA